MHRGYEHTVNTLRTSLTHSHPALGTLFWDSAVSCQTPRYPHSLTATKMLRDRFIVPLDILSKTKSMYTAGDSRFSQPQFLF